MTPTTNGFAQKALIIVIGVLATALMGFFVWLATAVIDIRERVVRIEVTVASLVETRTATSVQNTERTNRRMDQLEKAAEGK